MSKWPSFFLLIPVVWPTLRFLYAKPEYLIFLQFDNWVKICSIRTKYECFSMHLIYAIQFELIYAVDGHRLVRYFEIIIKKFKRIKNLKKNLRLFERWLCSRYNNTIMAVVFGCLCGLVLNEYDGLTALWRVRTQCQRTHPCDDSPNVKGRLQFASLNAEPKTHSLTRKYLSWASLSSDVTHHNSMVLVLEAILKWRQSFSALRVDE